jgi:hypothetical protein
MMAITSARGFNSRFVNHDFGVSHALFNDAFLARKHGPGRLRAFQNRQCEIGSVQ